MFRQDRQNRGDIARPCADFEHALLAINVERLKHARDKARFAHRLAAGDRQRQIALSKVGELMRHEHLARDRLDRAQDVGVADALRAQLQQQRGAVFDGGVSGHQRVSFPAKRSFDRESRHDFMASSGLPLSRE